MLLTPPSMRLLLNFDNFLPARLTREIITKQQMHPISCLASDDSYLPEPKTLGGWLRSPEDELDGEATESLQA